MILKIQIMYFQELFTESKKLAVLSFSVVAKLARTPKSYTFLDLRIFQSQNWSDPFYLAPDNFWNPIFGQVVAFCEFPKRYLQILEIFWSHFQDFLKISTKISPELRKNSENFRIHVSDQSDEPVNLKAAG